MTDLPPSAAECVTEEPYQQLYTPGRYTSVVLPVVDEAPVLHSSSGEVRQRRHVLLGQWVGRLEELLKVLQHLGSDPTGVLSLLDGGRTRPHCNRVRSDQVKSDQVSNAMKSGQIIDLACYKTKSSFSPRLTLSTSARLKSTAGQLINARQRHSPTGKSPPNDTDRTEFCRLGRAEADSSVALLTSTERLGDL